MCHLQKKKKKAKANVFQKQTLLPRALLAHPAILPFQAIVNRKAQPLSGRDDQICFTPGPLMCLQGFLLEAQFTVSCRVPQTPPPIGAGAALGMPLSAGHVPTKGGFLLCQAQSFYIGN